MYPKQYLILQNCVSSQTFYPNLPIFLHGYIRHIRDISQLWIGPQVYLGPIKTNEAALVPSKFCNRHHSASFDFIAPAIIQCSSSRFFLFGLFATSQ